MCAMKKKVLSLKRLRRQFEQRRRRLGQLAWISTDRNSPNIGGKIG